MFNLKKRSVTATRVLWGTALCLALSPAMAQAQENLPAPAGWRKVQKGNDTVFLANQTAGTFTVKKLAPLPTSFASWFNAQVNRDSAMRGKVLKTKVLPPDSGVYCVEREFYTRDGARETLFYVGYPVGKFARLTYFTAPTERTLLQHVKTLKPLGAQIAAIDQKIRNGQAATTSAPRPANPASVRRNIPIAKPPRL